MERSFTAGVTRWIGLRLSRFGVDAQQYHFLLQSSLKLDFRSAGSVLKPEQQSQTASALKFTLLLNLIFSVILSLVMLAASKSSFVFSTMLLGYSMVMVAMSVLIEFGLAVISPDDFQVLAHRPISSRTFFAVKSSNLLFYVLLLGTSLNIVPALVGVAVRGSQWHFPLVYFLVASGASVFVAGTMVALYGLLLRTLRYERLKDLLVYAQIAFSFVFFFGFQVFPRLLGDVNAFTARDIVHSWAVAFPSVWFAGVVEVALGNINGQTLALAALAVIVCVVIVPLALRNVSLDYSEQLGRIAASSSKTKSAAAVTRRRGASAWFNRLLLRDSEERAFFYFFLRMFRRNRLLKLQILPNFGVAIAMMAVALLQGDKLQNPFENTAFSMAAMFPVIAFVFAGMGVTVALPYSDEYQGGWIFPVAPIGNRAKILTALKKVVILLLFVPLFLINWILFAYFWPWRDALSQSVYALVIGLFALQLLLFMVNDFPFSRKLEKGAASKRFMFAFVIYGIVGVAVALPYLVATRPIWFIALVAALLGIAWLLGHFNNRRYVRKTALSSE
jgi:ABC-2 type transport system permease protein